MAALKMVLLLALVAFPALPSAVSSSEALAGPNPIRKVVSLLQALQKKVEEEGEQEEELMEKFFCYCKKGQSQLSSSINNAGPKIAELEAAVKAGEEQKVQFEADVKQARVDRDDAKAAIAEATAIREKDAAAFAAYKAEAESNIAAMKKAIAALEKGAGGFLQTGAAQSLANAIRHTTDLAESDREEVLAFLQGKEGYAPSSGEVTGILKQLQDEFEEALATAMSKEEASKSAFEGLLAAKKKEIEALTESIETKTERIGELGVSIVQMKNDAGETAEALLADKEFLANLEASCNSKQAEWEERQKTRSEELAALADTIKMLNDDDALDLFKHTLPGAASSFIQMATSASEMRARAMEALRTAERGAAAAGTQALLDRVVLALQGKQIGFEKIIQLIDDLIATLKKEQQDDEHKKEYCGAQFDQADDKKKELERAVSDAETAIAKTQEAIARTAEEIEALEAGIKALDKDVAEATEQRQRENKEYVELMSSNTAAKELLGMAKNRLQKFYNPSLYKEGAAALVQVSLHVQRKGKADPGPAPETFGEYGKKSEESAGVIEMINMLIADLDKEITEAEAEEKNSQKSYEKLAKDAAEKRTADSKALTQKQGMKADLESQLQSLNGSKASASNELEATEQYIQALHNECDWLLQYFDTRKEARTGEIESLGKAKDVLNGASYSLLETKSSRRAFLVKRSA